MTISSLIYHLTIKQDVGRESSRNIVIIISLFSEEIHIKYMQILITYGPHKHKTLKIKNSQNKTDIMYTTYNKRLTQSRGHVYNSDEKNGVKM